MSSEPLPALKNAFGAEPPDVAVILGSGLSAVANAAEKSKRLPYAQIPGFPKPGVAGHAGECVVGAFGSRRALFFCGRFHLYEGHTPEQVVLPVRLAAKWGIRHLVATNAAGGVRKEFHPGDLVLIRDHLNFMGVNPLQGFVPGEKQPRFVDMTNAYDPDHREELKSIARTLKLPLPEGVYAALPGPSYETPAEIKMLATLGADLVGMSTVPEVIVARQEGMRVVGISCVTNWAAGVKGGSEKIDHAEVLENTSQARKDVEALLTKWISSFAPSSSGA